MDTYLQTVLDVLLGSVKEGFDGKEHRLHLETSGHTILVVLEIDGFGLYVCPLTFEIPSR